MEKYRKYRSSYILKKLHQYTNKGVIQYRDWVTTGGWDRFVPGKTPYYRDGNFVFTTSNISSAQKKQKYGEWVGTYTYDDVKNATKEANEIEVNQSSNDLRDFAYFGSCVELVRASLEGIIADFPAQITGTNIILQRVPDTADGEFTEIAGAYIISNPFEIDLHHKNIIIEDGMNPMRYMSYSYKNYTLNDTEVTSYSIVYSPNYDEIIQCPQDHMYEELVTVTINGNFTIRGLYVDSVIVFVSNSPNFALKPKQEIIDEYFQNLEGFERQLLNRNTVPLYKNTFITPIEGEKGVKYVNRDYIFPSNGYQIDIESPLYISFVNSLISLATVLDEYDCDNLYKNLTHEAIKNYDWTYTREYSDGEEQDNIDGGDRVEQLLRLFGRVLDDIKRDIDGIKNTTNITYDGYNNQANALLSDKLDLSGWEVYSTIPALKNADNTEFDTDTVKLTSDFLEAHTYNWYPAYNTDNVTTVNMDNEFMRRMILNSKKILSSKGTVQAIDMVMGMFGFGNDDTNSDYTVTEEYATVVPKETTEELHDTLYEINMEKNIVREYEDEDDYSGVPIKDLYFKYKEAGAAENVIRTVPYYDNTKTYDGYLYFQQNGGWMADDVNSPTKYKETLNYLNVVSNISDLFQIEPQSLNPNDIYYVVSIDDVIDHYDTLAFRGDLSLVEHTFYLKNLDYAANADGWENTYYGSQEIKDKAAYLESIVSININNNPHTGYGKYDNGKSYFEYMAQPFKYAIDNNRLDTEYSDLAEANKFTITEHQSDEDRKVKIVTLDELKGNYYLNSKILIFHNNIESANYKKYFKNVILNYLIQVIPSTTILVLENID